MSGTTFGYTYSSVTFTVQTTGTYDITAYGAQGGGANGATGGLGAEISGDFNLVAGEVLTIVVGGQGAAGGNQGGGGGGGSFVIETFNGTEAVDTPLVVAGGGGGAGNLKAAGGASNGGSGGTSTSGGSGNYTGGGAGGTSGGGGSGGPAAYGGGGGGGFTGNGGSAQGGGGYSYAGGSGGGTYNQGGFGGGGGGGSDGGGGGGGYSGGGGGGGGGPNGFYGGGGGGGGSFDSGINRFLEAGEHKGNGLVSIVPLCYLRGTHLLTPTGEVFVEDLKIGDLVVTRFAGIQKVRWIGRQTYDAAFVRGNPDRVPVCIRAGALENRVPARDLYVSPGHSILVDGQLILARALVNGITITQDWSPVRIQYYQIELQAHDCVIAEGAWAETFADGQGLRAQFHNAAEFDRLYPHHVSPPQPLLCAPRPDRGAELDAALRPVVARCAGFLPPGPLQGCVDRVGGAWTIDGWAFDPNHPDYPVLLEVLLEDRVIGTVLACDFRLDLKDAGLGRGRCAFFFSSPVRLHAESLDTLRIRRAADGTDLSISPTCRETIRMLQQQPDDAALPMVA
jgi:hypothetical protein